MSLSVLLIPLIIFLIVFLMFAFSAIFHVIRFELLNMITILMTVVFGFGTFFILSISISYMTKIDWKENITFNLFNDTSTEQTDENAEDNVLTF